MQTTILALRRYLRKIKALFDWTPLTETLLNIIKALINHYSLIRVKSMANNNLWLERHPRLLLERTCLLKMDSLLWEQETFINLRHFQKAMYLDKELDQNLTRKKRNLEWLDSARNNLSRIMITITISIAIKLCKALSMKMKKNSEEKKKRKRE